MILPRLLKHTAGCPRLNWVWLRCTDLREDEGLEFNDYEDCEFCGHEKIRFVHELKHSDWPHVIRVGRICADHYTAESINDLTKAENIVRNRSARRQRFPTHRSWRISARGNFYIEYQDSHIIVIKEAKASYKLRIDGKLGTKSYPTDRDARLGAFDYLTRRAARASSKLQLRR